MPIELLMLTLSVALLFVLIVIQAAAGAQAQGLDVMAGHRDDMKAPSPWQARTKRIVDNHREGLILFAPLILVAAQLNISNELTVWGAQLFFYARVAHAVIYLAGWPKVRPLAWAVGIIGTIMVFVAVITSTPA